jgi:hypothetical protein
MVRAMPDHRSQDERLAARRRGYDIAWQKLRARHLAANPLCVVCGLMGRQVDHIQTISDNPRRRLDPTNLQTLCDHHHSLITNAFDIDRSDGAGGVMPSGQVYSDGRHLDPSHPWFDATTTPDLGRAGRKAVGMAGNRPTGRR